VNGVVVRKNAEVGPGDEVVVGTPQALPSRPPPVPVLHQDEDLIAIDKPAGLISVGTERERQHTALALVRAWLAGPGRRGALWPAHRLDRETSGVLLFARTPEARAALQAGWPQVSKRYLAVVEGRPEPPEGRIDQPLREDENLRVLAGEHPDAKPARTRYALEHAAGGRALLRVELETGRRHQIRVHLAWLGVPVVGDPRYGRAGERLGLHAHELELRHPRDGRALLLRAPPPRAFRALLPAP